MPQLRSNAAHLGSSVPPALAARVRPLRLRRLGRRGVADGSFAACFARANRRPAPAHRHLV